MADIETSNFQLFRDLISEPLIEKSSTTPEKKTKRNRLGRKSAIKPVVAKPDEEVNDAEELAEFIEYLAREIFQSLPPELRTLTYSKYINDPILQNKCALPLTDITTTLILNAVPVTVPETLDTYSLLPAHRTTSEFLIPILNSYVTTTTTAPPPPRQTRDLADGCEICERSWIPLTYHHLIPRMVHAKAVKRGWHTEDQLENVAWLCRACHSFVHRVAGHEELAKEYYTVEKLVGREDVRKFAEWVGKVRWKAQ
ncbi:hypothetical protein BGZ60DRAFT_394135 [Tricladium varicosporioides]|nr:hypothetical protein BGZ60DRAFT_394135 [Hymenoscyphus varicosporioides]